MIKRVLAATLVLPLVFFFGCADISAPTGDLTRISHPGIIMEVTSAQEWPAKQIFQLSTLAPDLIVETITWSPDSPSKGDSVTISAGIKNQGNRIALPFRIYLYINGFLNSYQDVQSIDAGNLVTKTFTWTAQAESNTIKVVIDEENWVAESNESNNEKTITILTLAPDLIIQTITWLPASPLEGDNVTFTVTIKNQGSGKADYSNLACYVDDTYLTNALFDSIDSGDTASNTLVWTAQAGSHAIKIVTDPANKVAESDENNNEETIAFPTLAPDLIIQSITWSPDNPAAGGEVTFAITIKNQGRAGAGSSSIHLYIDDTSSSSQNVQSINTGDLVTETFTWTARAGLHAIKVVIDPYNRITENDESNNEKTVTFSGASAPDLIIPTITWAPESPSTGDNITFTVTIKNQGNSKAAGFFTAFYIDNDQLAPIYLSSIEPGATASHNFTWIALAGSHAIKAVANYNNKIPESNHDNNETTVIYPVPPDLFIQAITWSPANPSESDNMTFTVTAKNRGGSKADYSSIAYYIDDTYVAFTPIDPISPGATANTTFTWTAQVGQHSIKVIIDPYNKVNESIETNNEKTTAFSVFLSPVPVSTPASTPGTKAPEATAGQLEPLYAQEEENQLALWLFVFVGILLVSLSIAILLEYKRRRG